MRPMKFGIGQPVRRLEDQRFVTGAGRYTDDLLPQGTAYGVVLRSPHAHARFTIGDLSAAREIPGVLLVLTAADLAGLGDLPCIGLVQNSDGEMMRRMPYPVLARGKVRHVGDAVAFVVAETLDAARDALDVIPVEWEPLPAAPGIKAAEAQGAPLVWDEAEGNVAFDADVGDKAKTEAAFSSAKRTISLTLVNNRVVTNYLEPRACLAEYDGGNWTITLGSQGSHDIRDILAKRILKVAPERVRVVTPDVGGGFGTKMMMHREYPLCAVAAERLKRPVKWYSDRTEHFLSDAQGRDNIVTMEMALDENAKFLALRVDLKGDLGAYLSKYAPFVPWNGAFMAPGAYDIPAVYARVRGYYTHTLPVDAYRGAGRPEAAFAIERFVDYIARELGMSQDEIRRRNFIQPDAMPKKTETGRVYDVCEFEAHMRRAMEVAEWERIDARSEEARRSGKVRGIGLATYIEACSGGSPEPADLRLDPDGGVTILIGTQSTGQGHATAYAQIASQALDLPVERIRVEQGDTAALKTGGGTGGSRSIPVGGVSVQRAADGLADKLKAIAADLLEAGIADLELVDGTVRVAGTDRAVTFEELAASPKATPELLSARDEWTPPDATYPNGTHVCEVELDPETATVEVVRYTVVDDFGVTLNPLLLAGQVHGGIVQGVGQALHERTVYDADGQLLTASFMDYRMPRAADFPDIHFETRNVRSTTNALGMKGAGEAGCIGSTPAVMNAVVDALERHAGIRHIDMPVTPDRVFGALAQAGGRG